MTGSMNTGISVIVMADRRFSDLNNFSQGQAGRNALSSGPSWAFYKNSVVIGTRCLAKPQRRLCQASRLCGYHQRLSIRRAPPIIPDLITPKHPARGWRTIVWEVSDSEAYEVQLWNNLQWRSLLETCRA